MGHVVEVKDVAEDEHGGQGGPEQSHRAQVGRLVAGRADSLVIKVAVEQRVQVSVKDPDGRQDQRHQA